ncbi:MAG: hypothetical protein JXP37_05420 [Coriobacteriia bacterium]|nr:hypothetical protein [Coriobacteriia bacterium]
MSDLHALAAEANTKPHSKDALDALRNGVLDAYANGDLMHIQDVTDLLADEVGDAIEAERTKYAALVEAVRARLDLGCENPTAFPSTICVDCADYGLCHALARLEEPLACNAPVTHDGTTTHGREEQL